MPKECLHRTGSHGLSTLILLSDFGREQTDPNRIDVNTDSIICPIYKRVWGEGHSGAVDLYHNRVDLYHSRVELIYSMF